MAEFGLVGLRGFNIFFHSYLPQQQINSVDWFVLHLCCGPAFVPPQVKVFGRSPKVSGILACQIPGSITGESTGCLREELSWFETPELALDNFPSLGWKLLHS